MPGNVLPGWNNPTSARLHINRGSIGLNSMATSSLCIQGFPVALSTPLLYRNEGLNWGVENSVRCGHNERVVFQRARGIRIGERSIMECN
jgi:hypothetical protein